MLFIVYHFLSSLPYSSGTRGLGVGDGMDEGLRGVGYSEGVENGKNKLLHSFHSMNHI